MADWAMVALTAAGILVAVGVPVFASYIKLNGSMAMNTQAIKTLTDYMARKDTHDDKQDEQLDDHERRITKIETTHEVKGCVEVR
jgi:hypothetical protein